MKIELALSDVETRRWKGLCLIDGELFKVILFPGSATTDWTVQLTPTLFVECTPENKMTVAIEKGYKMWEIGEVVSSEDEFRVMLKAINEHPEMLEEIRKALQKKDER